MAPATVLEARASGVITQAASAGYEGTRVRGYEGVEGYEVVLSYVRGYPSLVAVLASTVVLPVLPYRVASIRASILDAFS